MKRHKTKGITDLHLYLPTKLAEMVEDVATINDRTVSKQITVWIEKALANLARLSKGMER